MMPSRVKKERSLADQMVRRARRSASERGMENNTERREKREERREKRKERGPRAHLVPNAVRDPIPCLRYGVPRVARDEGCSPLASRLSLLSSLFSLLAYSYLNASTGSSLAALLAG